MEPFFLKRTWAEIDLNALRDNYRHIAAGLTPGCQVIAVVKADAYGHGAIACAHLLRDQGVSYFAVSNLEEALQLRQGGIAEPVLILSHTPPKEAAVLAEQHISQTVIDRDYGEALEQAAAAAGVTVTVHIKVDTGMSRVGFFYQNEDAAALADMAAVCRLPHLHAEGIFTHFSAADEEDAENEAFTRRQFAHFTDAVSRLNDAGISFSLRHCCNSAATLRFPEMHLDAVRPGLILYGLVPAPFFALHLPLRPVMTVKSAITQVKSVPADTDISYGRRYRTSQPTRLATLPMGYADGLPRRLSNRWSVCVHGQPAPLRGRICMDQCLLDVSHIPDAAPGDTVTVMGGDGAYGADAFAEQNDTISYEVVCGISRRVPRLFLRDGQVVDQLNYLIPPVSR